MIRQSNKRILNTSQRVEGILIWTNVTRSTWINHPDCRWIELWIDRNMEAGNILDIGSDLRSAQNFQYYFVFDLVYGPVQRSSQ